MSNVGQPAEPVSTYRERIPGLRRTFTLFSDRVVVNGAVSLGNKFEALVILADLRPDYGTNWVRTRHFRMAIFALLMCSPLVIIPCISGTEMPLRILIPFLAVYALPIIYFLVSLRRVEFREFQNQGGLKLLDVARAGPDKDHYDAFIELLVQQIRGARDGAEWEHDR